MCGEFNPAKGFTDTLTINNANKTVFSGTSYTKWGGPYGGEFQTVFAESWKVKATDAGALFTADECESGEPYSGPPPVEFESCPELEAQAEAQCPSGDLHETCIADVGMTCDLTRWVDAAKEGQREQGFA